MTWQKILGQEIKYFLLIVFLSLLFWFALAMIVEQDIIAPEYLYLRERNAFFLTIVFFYIIRLSAWTSENRETHVDGNRETEDLKAINNQLRCEAGQLTIGEAKDAGGQWKRESDQYSVISEQLIVKKKTGRFYAPFSSILK